MTTSNDRWNKAMRKLSRAAATQGATAPVLDKLETKPCGRCGGSGSFSWNRIHGDRCYGCNGKGTVLTKRGQAAALFLDEIRKVPANTVQVGDIVRVNSITFGGTPFDYFAKVTVVGPSTTASYWKEGVSVPYFYIDTEHAKYGKSGMNLCSPTDLVRKGWSKEEKAEQFKKALEFQATLTVAGTPRKVR